MSVLNAAFYEFNRNNVYVSLSTDLVYTNFACLLQGGNVPAADSSAGQESCGRCVRTVSQLFPLNLRTASRCPEEML